MLIEIQQVYASRIQKKSNIAIGVRRFVTAIRWISILYIVILCFFKGIISFKVSIRIIMIFIAIDMYTAYFI